MPRSKAIRTLLVSLATLPASFPVIASAQNAVSARPGTINYIEGQASLEGQQLSGKSVRHAELAKGQYLATANGKAEVLLTPGVFLRLDKDTTIKMIAPGLTHTEVQLTQGRAGVEVDQLYKQNNILIDLNNGQTQLVKNGFYQFDASNNTVRVFKGEAAAFATLTPQPNEKPLKVKEGKQLSFTGDGLKPVGFNRKNAESNDPLYSWSSLRSSYLGEANLSLASSYAGQPGYGNGYASSWLWSPSLYSYTWLPGNGLFWSPFGYGFYSPYYLYGGGSIYGGYGGYGGGYYRGGSGGNRGVDGYRAGVASRNATGAAGSAQGNSVSGGSFHAGASGGGGGSHGGGGGGRR